MKKKIQRLLTAERRPRAFEMAKAGFNYRQIAEQLDVSAMTICKDIRKYIDELNSQSLELADRYRRVQLERIESAIKAIWTKVGSGHLGAINTLIRLMEREARLLGLDAPTKIDIEQKIRTIAEEEGIDPEEAVREVERLLEEVNIG